MIKMKEWLRIVLSVSIPAISIIMMMVCAAIIIIPVERSAGASDFALTILLGVLGVMILIFNSIFSAYVYLILSEKFPS